MQPMLGDTPQAAALRAGCTYNDREQRVVHLWAWKPGAPGHRWPPLQGTPCLCGETRWER